MCLADVLASIRTLLCSFLCICAYICVHLCLCACELVKSHLGFIVGYNIHGFHSQIKRETEEREGVFFILNMRVCPKGVLNSESHDL